MNFGVSLGDTMALSESLVARKQNAQLFGLVEFLSFSESLLGSRATTPIMGFILVTQVLTKQILVSNLSNFDFQLIKVPGSYDRLSMTALSHTI